MEGDFFGDLSDPPNSMAAGFQFVGHHFDKNGAFGGAVRPGRGEGDEDVAGVIEGKVDLFEVIVGGETPARFADGQFDFLARMR